jgi:hypothetical protein
MADAPALLVDLARPELPDARPSLAEEGRTLAEFDESGRLLVETNVEPDRLDEAFAELDTRLESFGDDQRGLAFERARGLAES